MASEQEMHERKRRDDDRDRARRLAIVHAEVLSALGDCSDALARIDKPGHGCWPYTNEAVEVRRTVDDLIVTLAGVRSDAGGRDTDGSD